MVKFPIMKSHRKLKNEDYLKTVQKSRKQNSDLCWNFACFHFYKNQKKNIIKLAILRLLTAYYCWLFFNIISNLRMIHTQKARRTTQKVPQHPFNKFNAHKIVHKSKNTELKILIEYWNGIFKENAFGVNTRVTTATKRIFWV